MLAMGKKNHCSVYKPVEKVFLLQLLYSRFLVLIQCLFFYFLFSNPLPNFDFLCLNDFCFLLAQSECMCLFCNDVYKNPQRI